MVYFTFLFNRFDILKSQPLVNVFNVWTAILEWDFWKTIWGLCIFEFSSLWAHFISKNKQVVKFLDYFVTKTSFIKFSITWVPFPFLSYKNYKITNNWIEHLHKLKFEKILFSSSVLLLAVYSMYYIDFAVFCVPWVKWLKNLPEVVQIFYSMLKEILLHKFWKYMWRHTFKKILKIYNFKCDRQVCFKYLIYASFTKELK